MLGELVKWIGIDGGWRTGRRVKFALHGLIEDFVLVQHSCTVELCQVCELPRVLKLLEAVL